MRLCADLTFYIALIDILTRLIIEVCIIVGYRIADPRTIDEHERVNNWRYLLSVVRTPHRLSSNPAPHTALWQHCRKCQGVSHVITWSITVLVYCAFPIESGRPTFCLFMQCRTVKSKIESLVLFCDSDLRKFNDTFASMI